MCAKHGTGRLDVLALSPAFDQRRSMGRACSKKTAWQSKICKHELPYFSRRSCAGADIVASLSPGRRTEPLLSEHTTAKEDQKRKTIIIQTSEETICKVEGRKISKEIMSGRHHLCTDEVGAMAHAMRLQGSTSESNTKIGSSREPSLSNCTIENKRSGMLPGITRCWWRFL